MKACISEIILPDLGLEAFFAESARCGYDGVELVIGGDMPLQLSNSREMVPQIRAMSRHYSLPVESLVQWQCTGDLLLGGQYQRIAIEETCQALEIAQALGCGVSLHTLGAMHPEVYYEDALEHAKAALKAIAPTAEGCGVALAVEFVWNGFLFSPVETR